MAIIHWFRRDLRLNDNTAFNAASLASNGAVIPCFVLDHGLLKGRQVAPARVQFLLESLRDLDMQLRQRGSRLVVRAGDPVVELARLAGETGAHAIYFNRDYTPRAVRRDRLVIQVLQAGGCEVRSFKDLVIHEENEVLTKVGKPYTIFTPYKRAWLAIPKAENPVLACEYMGAAHLPAADTPFPSAGELGFTVTQSVPAGGETEGLRLLDAFIGSGKVAAYNIQRDRLADDGTSRLSAHLRFGTISPRLCYARAVETLQYRFPPTGSHSIVSHDGQIDGTAVWISELIWREFYMQVLYHFPHADHANFNQNYNNLRWGSGDPSLEQSRFSAWCAGQTGYPIVDAAMRQLNQTAWMHNRARMIVASFLTKDLLMDWRVGEDYFMQKLVDGDPAANNGGWQWAAGTGTDAQPCFRVFNPVLQSRRYDPDGAYIRRFVPELANVPGEFIHEPWRMPAALQQQAGCIIGATYPAPIVEHARQKEIILRRFKEIRS